MEKRKKQWQEVCGVGILTGAARKEFTKRVIFKQRSERGEGGPCRYLGKSFTGSRRLGA